MSFDPFDKPFSSIEAKDLSVFKDISEGWFVDYKRKSIGIKDTAKHLCSFANQFGGYLVFGIVESNDSDKCAEQFPGLPRHDIEQLSLEIREASSAHSNPEIYYEEKVVPGPCIDIGLPEEMSILVVYIPQSPYPPHIHSCGKVYLRQGDQSKPKEVTDRYTFDKLIERSETNKQKKIDFFNERPDLYGVQREAPFLSVLLTPGPNAKISASKMHFSRFKQYARGEVHIANECMPMQLVHAFGRGFIAKQTTGNDPSMALAGVKYWHNRTIRFDLPLSYGSPSDLFSRAPGNTYINAVEFTEEYSAQGFHDVPVCDYSQVFLSLRSLCNMYLRILLELGDKFDIYSTFEVMNTQRSIPFIDSAKYIASCKANGIPLTQDKCVKFRAAPFYDNMIPLKEEYVFSGEHNPIQHHFVSDPIGLMIQHYLGIMNDFERDYEEYTCRHLLKSEGRP